MYTTMYFAHMFRAYMQARTCATCCRACIHNAFSLARIACLYTKLVLPTITFAVRSMSAVRRCDAWGEKTRAVVVIVCTLLSRFLYTYTRRMHAFLRVRLVVEVSTLSKLKCVCAEVKKLSSICVCESVWERERESDWDVYKVGMLASFSWRFVESQLIAQQICPHTLF